MFYNLLIFAQISGVIKSPKMEGSNTGEPWILSMKQSKTSLTEHIDFMELSADV